MKSILGIRNARNIRRFPPEAQGEAVCPNPTHNLGPLFT